MAELRPVHEMEMDRATSKLELVRTNPTRQFLLSTENGMALYTWQNGHWFDTGGQWIQEPEKEVPLKFRTEIEAVPVSAGSAVGPAVTAVCKFCSEQMNQSEIEQHYIQHVTQAMAQAGAKAPEKKSDANTHGRP